MECEIVISGMSGRFPESDNIAELSENLFNKVDLITEDNRRWEPGLWGLPKGMGKLKDISRFDNHFFDMHNIQANLLDPQPRMLLEAVYEAIVDAGYDPEELRGRNIGVYTGNTANESEMWMNRNPKPHDWKDVVAVGRTMFANIISFCYNFKGIKDISSLDPETKLADLDMDSLLRVEMTHYLEREFNIALSASDLRELKIKDLKILESNEDITSLEQLRSSETATDESVVGHFHSLSMKDLVPYENIVHMNSVQTGTPLFIVHPLEGSVAMLHALAELLSCPVYGIQFTPEAPSNSVEELAAWYWKCVKGIDVLTKSIYLAGYSYGVLPAYEMAAQAERDCEQYPIIKRLILLDGSSAVSYIHEHMLDYKNSWEINVQVYSLMIFAYQLNNSILLEKEALINMQSFDERIISTVEKIVNACSNLETKTVKEAFNLYFKKILISLKYAPKHKLKMKVLLIKASETVGVSEIYELDKVSRILFRTFCLS